MAANTTDLDAILAHSEWLRRLARRLIGPSSAEDAVQDTLVAALRAPPDPARPARPWLASVLRNVARMRYRADSRRERREHVSAADAALTAAAPDEALVRAETYRALVELVLALEEPSRTVLVRHYFDGDTLAAIARRDGVPEGTVRWRHQQALEQLRRQLAARAGGQRGAWRAALAPLAATTNHTGALTMGGLLVKKVVIGVALAGLLGVTAWWRLDREEPAGSLPSHWAAPALRTPSAELGSATTQSAPDARALAHVRQLGAADRQRMAEQIARARARRATAGQHANGASSGTPASSVVEPETVLDAMLEVAPFLRECTAQAGAALGSAGLVVDADLALTGDPDVGTVIEARELFDESGHAVPAALDECVRTTLQSLALPALADGDTAEFHYTIELGGSGP